MPASVSVVRDSSFSVSPLRRAGFSITRTFTPRRFAPITALSSVSSVNRNIRMFSDFFAPLMASRIGLAVSSGRTINVCDMGMTWMVRRRRCYFTRVIGDAFHVPSSASGFGQ